MGARNPPPRVVGRDREARVLTEALDAVATGLPSMVLVEGEAGIGKTCLLETVLAAARGRGMQVVAGRAAELERNRPFGLAVDALGCTRSAADGRRAAIAALLGAQADDDRGPITVTSDHGLQFRVIDALTDLVEELAMAGPLVIGMDDVQWADPSSVLALGAMSRRVAALPVALVVCFRPTPRIGEWERLTDVLRTSGARYLLVRPLTGAAVRELVADVLAADPAPGLLAAMSGATGNPLFVKELLAALHEAGAIERAGGRAEVTQVKEPPTLRLTILHRLSVLSDPALNVLQAASVLGSAFSLTDLATIADRPVLDLSTAMTDALRAGVLEDDGARLRFRHDLVRDSIYEDLPVGVRRAMHRDAGQRLARSGASALNVAEHLARGATGEDTLAVTWLTRAAREAAATSPGSAADLLGRAVDLMDPTDPERDRLRTEQARSLIWAGRIADAEAVCRTVLDRTPDPELAGDARICLGHALLVGGRPRLALAELAQAVESPELADAERARGLAWMSGAYRWLGDLSSSADAAEKARVAAEATGDPLGTAIAGASRAFVAELRGRPRDALAVIDGVVVAADGSPGRRGHRFPLHACRGFILVELDRLTEARATVDVGTRIAEDLGLHWHLPSYQLVRIYERYLAGAWDDALTEVKASLELAAETGEALGLVLVRSVLSMISLHRNNIGGAERAAATAVSQLRETGAHYRAQWAPWARALTMEAQGDPAGAYAALVEGWDHCGALGIASEYPNLGPDLVRLAMIAGATTHAREVAATLAEVASVHDAPSVVGAALHCRGLVERDPTPLLAAVTAYAACPRPLPHAHACEAAGVALTRAGRLDQARPLLGLAVDGYEQLDASRDLARVEAALRAAGVRRGRRGSRRRPQSGWRSLTPAEQAVAGLVADGLSNPQIGSRLFISRRTVQTHLAHVFLKLGLTSRAQLAAVVTRHRLGTQESGE